MRKLVYHFRSPKSNYSIENVYRSVAEEMKGHYEVSYAYCPKERAGVWAILINMIHARFRAGEINHVTGAVHYLCLVLPKKGLVLTVHDLRTFNRQRSIKRWLYDKLWYEWPLRRAEKIVFISDFTKEEILREFSLEPEKYVVISNSYDPSYRFVPCSKQSDVPVVLAVGTKENKNLERLVLAVKNMDIRLRIIGDLSGEQLNLLATSGVNYSSASGLSIEQMVSEYCGCDLVAFPSLYEGFGLPILEAQATGRPLLTSNRSPMREVASEGAHLVDPEDIEDIREGISKLLFDPSYRETKIRAGARNVQKYSMRAAALQHRRLYSSL